MLCWPNRIQCSPSICCCCWCWFVHDACCYCCCFIFFRKYVCYVYVYLVYPWDDIKTIFLHRLYLSKHSNRCLLFILPSIRYWSITKPIGSFRSFFFGCFFHFLFFFCFLYSFLLFSIVFFSLLSFRSQLFARLPIENEIVEDWSTTIYMRDRDIFDAHLLLEWFYWEIKYNTVLYVWIYWCNP